MIVLVSTRLAALFATLALLPLLAQAQTEVAARQPLQHFARLPQFERASLSPDGQKLVALLNEGDRTAVVLRPVQADQGGRSRVLAVSDNQKFHFKWVRWVGNDRVLASLRFPARRGFVETTETRLLSLPLDGGEPLQLSFGAASAGLRQQFQDEVIDWLPGDGRHVLLQLTEGDVPEPAVVRLNVYDGRRQIVHSPEKGVWHWVTDAQHRVRVGLRISADEQRAEVIAREPDGKAWRTLWQFNDRDEGVWPLGFGPDPQRLYVRAPHQGRLAVFVVQLDDPALPRSLLHAHPVHDVDGALLLEPSSGEVLGLRQGGSETDPAGEDARAELWSPAWRAQMQALDSALPGWSMRLLELSHDGQRYLAYGSGNGRPGRYFVGDRRSGQLQVVADTHPELAPERLAGKQTAQVKARDGLPLPVYLTLPRGRSLGDDGPALPLVLFPHGGPASRDDADFDPWAEFLADRGYAVLQVNFRGSDGYGLAFSRAGLKRWGLEMQDDLADGVAWAQQQGLGRDGRVCVVGGSYGGYAALMGLVKTPGLYRCAVSFAGVTDLLALIDHESDYIGGRSAAVRTLGDPAFDGPRLKATSPALQASAMRAPVLLVYGSADRVVPVAQSRAMARALKRAGKAHRYVELEGGDHFLSRQQHRLAFFAELEAFLDQQLQPGR
ncbi:MAG: alpha/beta hydrolase family protein [Rubrivivax sp.]